MGRQVICANPLSRAAAGGAPRRADAAVSLLQETGLRGHKCAIGAALAVIAGRQPAGAVLFTSDEDDMGKLCGPGVRVVSL
ncbi:hypothetical protein ACIPSH_06880 [Streptomyces iakyrus]|uniref:hypothetical protein n=1 Tax=Streptomyces iakyrus TaxID=68219 RepID=UPI003802617C